MRTFEGLRKVAQTKSIAAKLARESFHGPFIERIIGTIAIILLATVAVAIWDFRIGPIVHFLAGLAAHPKPEGAKVWGLVVGQKPSL